MSYLFNNQVGFVGNAVDGFNRLKVSQPFTLFDSQHRYQINDKWDTFGVTGGTATYEVLESAVLLSVGTTAGSKITRETKRVFAYQPGKSLLILNTFAMNQPKDGLLQRVGYFGISGGATFGVPANGIYVQQDGLTLSLCLASQSLNTITKVEQSSWNGDKFDGTGASGRTLDISKTNIFWTDIEWLGVGSVRCGFVIDGQLIHCHSFHHAGIEDDVYMTTAALPIRYEIKNTAGTASNSTLKQICSTVISEGGFSPTGRPRSYGLDLNQQRTLTTIATFYPVVSLRLNPAYPDSIVVPTDIGLLPVSTGLYKYKLVKGGTFTGDVWANTSSDSVVQYQSNTSATFTGGEDLHTGFISSTVQAGGSVDFRDGLFKFQLERDSLANTYTPFTLLVACDTATSNVVASMDWEEIT